MVVGPPAPSHRARDVRRLAEGAVASLMAIRARDTKRKRSGPGEVRLMGALLAGAEADRVADLAVRADADLGAQVAVAIGTRVRVRARRAPKGVALAHAEVQGLLDGAVAVHVVDPEVPVEALKPSGEYSTRPESLLERPDGRGVFVQAYDPAVRARGAYGMHAGHCLDAESQRSSDVADDAGSPGAVDRSDRADRVRRQLARDGSARGARRERVHLADRRARALRGLRTHRLVGDDAERCARSEDEQHQPRSDVATGFKHAAPPIGLCPLIIAAPNCGKR